ncbi:protein rep [Staphylococcus aureus]|uniref:protein rep n=1 Tax=Staphylococcus aureus TaxID=1280 RepID=UPI00226E0877|nr:protein rep [Staphylococcus aureus]
MHILEKKENYITQEEWVNLWQRALQVDYRPVANVKAIKPNRKGDKDIESAIKETSKYSVKSSDFLTDDDEKKSRNCK